MKFFYHCNLLISYILIFILKGYRYFVSPLLRHNCRFYPTCSIYAEEVIKRFGLVKGSCLSIGRLLRCHPFCPGGIDLPPEITKKTI